MVIFKIIWCLSVCTGFLLAFSVTETQLYFHLKDKIHENWVLDSIDDCLMISCIRKCEGSEDCGGIALGPMDDSRQSSSRTCLLLSYVNETDCSAEDYNCTREGYQVYMKEKPFITTTEVPTTTSTTTTEKPTTTTTTEEPTTTTTTTEVTTTTTTEVPTTTTTTEKPTTTTTTTEKPTTTTTTEKPTTTTTTTDKPTTSTTTTTEAPTTTTTTKASTTTTTEAPTTTTTQAPTTTTTEKSTTSTTTEVPTSTTTTEASTTTTSTQAATSTTTTETPTTTTEKPTTTTTEEPTTTSTQAASTTSTTTEATTTSTEKETTTVSTTSTTAGGEEGDDMLGECQAPVVSVKCDEPVVQMVSSGLTGSAPLFSDAKMKTVCRKYMTNYYKTNTRYKARRPFNVLFKCEDWETMSGLEICFQMDLVYIAPYCTELEDGFKLDLENTVSTSNTPEQPEKAICPDDMAQITLKLEKNEETKKISVYITCAKVIKK